MSLREAAEAAWLAQQQSATEGARDVLSNVLTPYDVSTLTVAAVDASNPSYRLVVFTDGEVHIAVRERTFGETDVLLVHPEGDLWVTDAPVTSLAQLHEILPPPVSTVPQWKPGIAVAVGEQYDYNGVIYEVLQAHTTQADWTPDKTPALWVVAS